LLLPLLAALRPDYQHPHARLRSLTRDMSATAVRQFAMELPGGEDDYRRELRETAIRLYSKAAQDDTRFFVDKAPPYALLADELPRVFPDAKLVFLWRNPLSVVASLVELERGRWNLHRYREPLFDSLASLVAAYECHRERVVGVRYEDLVSGEPAWRKIAGYLGIEFEPNALKRFSQVKLHEPPWEPGKFRYTTVSREPLTKWRQTIDNPIRAAWCRRYLMWIGRRRLTVMGYDLDALLAELAGVGRGDARQIGEDLLMLGIAAAREAAKAKVPPHAGDPSVWRLLLSADGR
jgi:hypothetical protein